MIAAALDARLLAVPLDPELPSWGEWLAYRTDEAPQASPYASFATQGPRCGADDTFHIVTGLFDADMPLVADGFAPAGTRWFHTQAEVAACRARDLALPLPS